MAKAAVSRPDPGGMNPKALAGLQRWAKDKGTSEISEHLEGHGFSEPGALAVWIRKQAIGEDAFKKHQEQARKKKAKEK